MIIELKKFGTTLVSRPSGKEAWLAFQSSLGEVKEDEEVVVDFEGVVVLTPSWADEFLTPLLVRFRGRVELRNTENASIKATMEILSYGKTRGEGDG